MPLAFFIGYGDAGDIGRSTIQRMSKDIDKVGSLATSADPNGHVVEPLEFKLASPAVEHEWRPLFDRMLCALARATTGQAYEDAE